MADRAVLARRPLVGRAGEMDAVVRLLEDAARDEAGALLISGEAGVGKTALTRETCDRVKADADVLWAPCLPLTSLAVPFLPLTSAIREWANGREVPLPVLGVSGAEGPAGFDNWLEDLCRQRPVLLVVDDLQWADQSTLDVLMYVLAGRAGRRLAVIATVRAGEEGEPLRRWLADVRRFPGVAELMLGRLDRVATGEQLAGLLGRPPHQSLIDAVFARTQGNAYLTTLLARGISPDARFLPEGLPTDLRDAATRAWRGLTRPAQALTRLIAVAGRPQRADQIRGVAIATAMSGDLVALLREAVDAAVLELGPDQSYWFVHPLLAEVLEHGLLPEERRRFHAAFATVLESSSNPAELAVEAAVDLADHHHAAGNRAAAYQWALVAADAAERAGGATEAVRLLRRALDLWTEVPDAYLSRLDLLQRVRIAAYQAGVEEEELAAVDELLAIVDSAAQPLLAADLLVRRRDLRHRTGREFAGLDDAREAVRISAPHPETEEHALALAALGHAELWRDIPSGPVHAEEAVRVARASGSAKALAWALTTRAMAKESAGAAEGIQDAEEAQANAIQARDFQAFLHATTWAGNCVDCSASLAVLERWRRGREALKSAGAPHANIAWLSACEASGLLPMGDWRSCEERLRVALGSTPGPMADVSARLTAALLSRWQGRQTDAEGHLARAEELFAVQSGFLGFEFDVVRAELAIGAGDTDRAFALAMTA